MFIVFSCYRYEGRVACFLNGKSRFDSGREHHFSDINFKATNLIPHLIPFCVFRAKSIKSKSKDSGKNESPESR